jgi:hypothetical protein
VEIISRGTSVVSIHGRVKKMNSASRVHNIYRDSAIWLKQSSIEKERRYPGWTQVKTDTISRNNVSKNIRKLLHRHLKHLHAKKLKIKINESKSTQITFALKKGAMSTSVHQ